MGLVTAGCVVDRLGIGLAYFLYSGFDLVALHLCSWGGWFGAAVVRGGMFPSAIPASVV